MVLGSPMTGDIKFSNRSFYYIEQFRVDIHFANFWQVKIDPIRFFSADVGQVTVVLLSLSKHITKNNPKNSRSMHRIWHKSFSMISLGKPIDFYWCKMSCLSSLVFICAHCFFLKMVKLCKDICSARISRTSAESFFLIGCHHKTSQKCSTSVVILWGKLLWIFKSVIQSVGIENCFLSQEIDFKGSVFHFFL